MITDVRNFVVKQADTLAVQPAADTLRTTE